MYHQISKKLKSVPPYGLKAVVDIQEQLSHLVYPGFVEKIPGVILQHLPRYLKAVEKRIEKLATNHSKDAQLCAQIKSCWEQYQTRAEKDRLENKYSPALEEYRWMIEELRVSFFAQELKTPYPVSLKRLEKQWELVRKG